MGEGTNPLRLCEMRPVSGIALQAIVMAISILNHIQMTAPKAVSVQPYIEANKNVHF